LNKIVITDDFESAIQKINPDESVVVKELKVEDVAKIRELAYVTSKEKRVILICAQKYLSVSQNALLKLLEEPPKNVEFVLLAKSKHSLLDTIKSRMVIEKLYFNPPKNPPVKLSKITNDKILDLLKEDFDKDEIKAIIYELINKDLDEQQLKILGDAIKMLELNIDKKSVLALVMLALKERM